MKKLYGYAAILLTSLMLVGCGSGSGYEFKDVVEIPDENDSNLPKATEVGANTAGAYYQTELSKKVEKIAWTYNYKSSNKYGLSATSCEIRAGSMNAFEFYIPGARSSEQAPIQFTFRNKSSINYLVMLQELSNQSFSSSQGTLEVSVGGVRSTNWQPIKVTKAELQFTRCRLINANNEFKGVSVAGTFTISGAAADTIPVNISEGRFDILFTSYDGEVFR